jgi:hypothetical protein
VSAARPSAPVTLGLVGAFVFLLIVVGLVAGGKAADAAGLMTPLVPLAALAYAAWRDRQRDRLARRPGRGDPRWALWRNGHRAHNDRGALLGWLEKAHDSRTEPERYCITPGCRRRGRGASGLCVLHLKASGVLA